MPIPPHLNAAKAIDALWSAETDREGNFDEAEQCYQQHCLDTAKAAFEAEQIELRQLLFKAYGPTAAGDILAKIAYARNCASVGV
jgi:hypothetical protein